MVRFASSQSHLGTAMEAMARRTSFVPPGSYLGTAMEAMTRSVIAFK